MLLDSCMPRLSPNAWKVVCYVAGQHLRVHPEWLDRFFDPSMFALQQDLEAVGIIDSPGESGERPYRTVGGGRELPGERTSRFAIISLEVFCRGMRLKRRWRDYGTGLSKSSVAATINEAVQLGILIRQRRKSGGRDQSSTYAINWDLVQEWELRRRKGRVGVSKSRTPH